MGEQISQSGTRGPTSCPLFAVRLDGMISERHLARSQGCSDNHDDGNNQTVETNSLSENEDKDHTNEDAISLGVGSDTSVTGDTNSKTSSEGRETAGKASTEVLVASLSINTLLNLSNDDDSDDNTIDTEDTSHDNGDETSEDSGGLDDGKGGDTNTGLGSTVGSTKVAEDESSGNTHVGKEVRSGGYKVGNR